ncbi:MAG: hypothetical protein ABEH38_01495 [Flavobacteriales bacterium]
MERVFLPDGTPLLMNQRLSFFVIPFLFFSLLATGQNDKGGHRLSIRGDFQALHESSSELFRKKMNGVIGGDLSVEYPLASSFFIAGGGTLSHFERGGDPTNLLQEETTMLSYGPFIKGGFRPYLSKTFYMEFSVKGIYRKLDFRSPRCKKLGNALHHGQTAFGMEPRIGFWWDTGDGLDFGAVLAHELLWERFHEDLICEELKPEPPDRKGKYRFWHFGFAFSADLKGK